MAHDLFKPTFPYFPSTFVFHGKFILDQIVKPRNHAHLALSVLYDAFLGTYNLFLVEMIWWLSVQVMIDLKITTVLAFHSKIAKDSITKHWAPLKNAKIKPLGVCY